MDSAIVEAMAEFGVTLKTLLEHRPHTRVRACVGLGTGRPRRTGMGQ